MATIQKKKQHILTAVDYEILQLVRMFHFLKVDQVMRLRVVSSKPKVQIRLKSLYDAKYLDRRGLPHIDAGKPEYIYALSTKGMNMLKEQGFTAFSRFRGDEFHAYAFPHLDHALAVNDFLIAGRLLPRCNTDITLIAMKHDLDMKRAPMRVTIDRRPSGGNKDEIISIVPDGFLDFRLTIAGRMYAMPVWVEVDRGTEWGKQLKQKLRGMIAAVQTQAFEDLFGVSSITVAIATTEGKNRCDLMRSYVKDELTNMGLLHLANVLLFAALPESLLDPQEVFLSPMWYTPDNNTPVPLLDISEE